MFFIDDVFGIVYDFCFCWLFSAHTNVSMNSWKLTFLFSRVLSTCTSFSVTHTRRLFSFFLLKLFSVQCSKSACPIRYSITSSLCACSWSSGIFVSPFLRVLYSVHFSMSGGFGVSIMGSLLNMACQARGYISYDAYLKSDFWNTQRSRFLKSRCHCCSYTRELQLHHINYKRITRERPSDLVTLCRDCHVRAHELIKEGKAKLINAHNILEKGTSKVHASPLYKNQMYKFEVESEVRQGLIRWGGI